MLLLFVAGDCIIVAMVYLILIINPEGFLIKTFFSSKDVVSC